MRSANPNMFGISSDAHLWRQDQFHPISTCCECTRGVTPSEESVAAMLSCNVDKRSKGDRFHCTGRPLSAVLRATDL